MASTQLSESTWREALCCQQRCAFIGLFCLVCPFQSQAACSQKTLSGGGPMSTWGRSSQLCSTSLPLNPSVTALMGPSLTTAEWSSNWLVGTLYKDTRGLQRVLLRLYYQICLTVAPEHRETFGLSFRHVQEGGGPASAAGPSDQRPCGNLCQQVQNRQLGPGRTCKCKDSGQARKTCISRISTTLDL